MRTFSIFHRPYRTLTIVFFIGGVLCLVLSFATSITELISIPTSTLAYKVGVALMLAGVFFFILNTSENQAIAERIISQGEVGVGIILTAPEYYDSDNTDDLWVRLHLAVNAAGENAILFESNIRQSMTSEGKNYYKPGMRLPVRFSRQEKIALVTEPPALPDFFRF